MNCCYYLFFELFSVPDRFALGTLRLSAGPHTTAHEIDQAVSHIQQAVLSEMVV